MAERAGNKIKYIIFVIAALLFAGCANQLPPGGGEVDTTPPEIIDIYPASGTVNYNETYFDLSFSEYVDKRSVKDAVFISPAIEGNLELDWSGRDVRVNLPSTLKENTTYVVTIGTDVVDYNNRNRMANAVVFTFSTGNKIDTKIISGKIFDPKPAGILVYAYKVNGDTINPSSRKPDYISQAGEKGNYLLLGLPEGTYRVFAVDDQMRDLTFQPGQDRIGIPPHDITLASDDSMYAGLNFILINADTSSPRITKSVFTDVHHLLMTYSEEIDSTLIKPENFYMYDSTQHKKYFPLYAFKGNTKAGEFVLTFDTTFSTENSYYIFADTMRDKSGNLYLNDFSSVIMSNRADTTKVLLSKMIPASGSKTVDFASPAFSFFFNDGFDSAAAKKAITFTDTLNKPVDYSVSFIDNGSFTITAAKFEAQKDYRIKLNYNNFIPVSGIKNDTTVTYSFRTISGLDFTGVSGKILDYDALLNPVIVLEKAEVDKLIYRQKPNADGTYNFDRIEPGKYIMHAFFDRDSSGTFSGGWYYPYKESEEFYFNPDTLNLRSRWVQTDVNFRIR